MVFSHRFATCTPYPLGPTFNHCVTALADGKALLSGGVVFGTASVATEVYDPVTDIWTGVGDLVRSPGGNPLQSAVRLTNGRVLMVLGNGPHQFGEDYDPTLQVWSSSLNPMPEFYYHPIAVALPNGKALVMGYGAGDRQATLYDSTTKMFSSAALLPMQGLAARPRQLFAAITMLNGKVLVTGGTNGDPGDLGTPLNYAAVYSPLTDSWAFVANGAMQHGRSNHHMELLPNGHVLISGGHAPGWPLHGKKTHDVYDPATNTISPVADSVYGRFGGSLLQIPDGKLVWAFGEGWDFIADDTVYFQTEVYEYLSNTWAAGPNVVTPRLGADTGLSRYYAALVGGSLLYVGAANPSAALAEQDAVEIFESPAATPPPVAANSTLKNAFTFTAPKAGFKNYFDFVG